MSNERLSALVDIIECASYLMKHPECEEETLALFCRCIRDHTKEYYRLSAGKDWKDSEYVEVMAGKGYDGHTVETTVCNDEQKTFLDDLFGGTIDTLNTMKEGAEKLYSKWKENRDD